MEQNTIPQRIQTYQTPDILLKIQQIIEKSTKVFNNYCTGNWDRIIVEAHCIGDVRTEGYFICNNIVSKMPVSLSTADLLSEIKNDMYKQASIEGAWLMCKIVFDTQKKFIIEFNYDNKASLPNDVFDNPERLETRSRSLHEPKVILRCGARDIGKESEVFEKYYYRGAIRYSTTDTDLSDT